MSAFGPIPDAPNRCAERQLIANCRHRPDWGRTRQNGHRRGRKCTAYPPRFARSAIMMMRRSAPQLDPGRLNTVRDEKRCLRTATAHALPPGQEATLTVRLSLAQVNGEGSRTITHYGFTCVFSGAHGAWASFPF